MTSSPLATYTHPVELKNVSIAYNENKIFENINFILEKGEFAYLTGPIGCGKSTLLKLLYGEIPFTEGELALVLGYNLKNLNIKRRQEMRRAMGLVFQSHNQLLYDRTIFDNLDFVLKATSKLDKKSRKEKIQTTLHKVNMEGKGYKMPHELSGGEAERICIARALIVNPSVILMDEPTTGLDQKTSIDLGKLMQNIAKNGTSVLMATHNSNLIKTLPANTIIVNSETRNIEKQIFS